MQAYSDLWNRFADSEFKHEQASEELDGKTSAIIMHLNRNGWISIRLDTGDTRKRIYKLKSPDQAVKEMTGGEPR